MSINLSTNRTRMERAIQEARAWGPNDGGWDQLLDALERFTRDVEGDLRALRDYVRHVELQR